MSFKPIYKLSLFFILITGMFTFGMLPNVEGVNSLWYNTEKEIEETEEEENKFEFTQHKIGHSVAKGKNISFYDVHKSITHKMSSVCRETCDIFFHIVAAPKTTATFSSLITNISPRYILFHCLVFYC